MIERKFLNDDPSMPGCSILNINYDKKGRLCNIDWTLGDCSRTINLEFDPRDYSLTDYKITKKKAQKMIKKAKILRDGAQKIIDAIENELNK